MNIDKLAPNKFCNKGEQCYPYDLADQIDCVNRNVARLHGELKEIEQIFTRLLKEHWTKEAVRRRERCW